MPFVWLVDEVRMGSQSISVVQAEARGAGQLRRGGSMRSPPPFYGAANVDLDRIVDGRLMRIQVRVELIGEALFAFLGTSHVRVHLSNQEEQIARDAIDDSLFYSFSPEEEEEEIDSEEDETRAELARERMELE